MHSSTKKYQGFFLIKPDGIMLYPKIHLYLQEYIFPYVISRECSFYKIYEFS